MIHIQLDGHATEAHCWAGGVRYSAGSVHGLCRCLADAGLPDDSCWVVQPGRPRLKLTSFQSVARATDPFLQDIITKPRAKLAPVYAQSERTKARYENQRKENRHVAPSL
jgi:hypothetical protein